MNGLSVVTVCMNRREHLLRSAALVAAWIHHSEHLIVDWSSAVPVRREQLPADPRIRLLRVGGDSPMGAQGRSLDLWSLFGGRAPLESFVSPK